MRDLIDHILKQLVDSPDKVIVREVRGQESTILEITVADADRKHAIGKDGRMVNALRTIAMALATKQHRRITVEVLN